MAFELCGDQYIVFEKLEHRKQLLGDWVLIMT